MSDSLPEAEAPLEPRHERRDVHALSLALLVILLLIGLFLADLAVAAIQSAFKRHAAESSAVAPPFATGLKYPAPRLEISRSEELQAVRGREELLVKSYGWVDRKAGVVRIPVERAIDLLVERGLPATSESVTAAELQQKRPEQREKAR